MRIPKVEYEVWDRYGNTEGSYTNKRLTLRLARDLDCEFPNDAPHVVVKVTREVVK